MLASIVPITVHHYDIDNKMSFSLMDTYFDQARVKSAFLIVHNGQKYVRYFLLYSEPLEDIALDEDRYRYQEGGILVFHCGYLSNTIKGINGWEQTAVTAAVK